MNADKKAKLKKSFKYIIYGDATESINARKNTLIDNVTSRRIRLVLGQ